MSSLKLHEEFLNKNKNEEKKNKNEQIFREQFNYQSPSFLVKDLYEGSQNKTDIIVKYLNESLIDLRHSQHVLSVPSALQFSRHRGNIQGKF